MSRKLAAFLAALVMASYAFVAHADLFAAQQPVSFDLPDLNGQASSGCPCTLGGICICDTNKCYCDAYQQAVVQKKPLVLGVDVDPPKGKNWLAARVAAAMVKYTPGQVIVARPVGSSLVIKAKMTGATAEAVQTVLSDPATTQAPSKTTVTYYDSAPSYFASGCAGAGAGGCAGVGAGGCSGTAAMYSAPMYSYSAAPVYYRGGYSAGVCSGGVCSGGVCSGLGFFR